VVMWPLTVGRSPFPWNGVSREEPGCWTDRLLPLVMAPRPPLAMLSQLPDSALIRSDPNEHFSESAANRLMASVIGAFQRILIQIWQAHGPAPFSAKRREPLTKTFRFLRASSGRRAPMRFSARTGTMSAQLVQETHGRAAFAFTGRESRTGCEAVLGYGWESEGGSYPV
jgi:hypothetical protein